MTFNEFRNVQICSRTKIVIRTRNMGKGRVLCESLDHGPNVSYITCTLHTLEPGMERVLLLCGVHKQGSLR